MSEPYWHWWAIITFFASGAFCGWIWTIAYRPARIVCPHCEHHVKVRTFRDHWKECLI